ncbi:response regulator [Parasulfuritortus cantonensis]|uniref:Response regulator n=2 Tax=Parasulfuritortus cantonensis TaxID=2528202 RepID=A0A4R1BKW6_9PROT|nr:response regulator [Parasulfuritortus cantonensis]
MAAKRILLVDDQEDIRLLLRLALAPLGAELLLATNGAEALRMAQERRPDVIILDVMMPGGLDGYQVCRSLRAETTTPRPFIVLLSAKGQQRDIEEGLRAGADHYMLKPFSPLELNDLIMRSQTA